MMAGARIAPNPQNRQALLANADRILAGSTAFIALTAPVRWSLVARGIDHFTENGLAAHPLDQLRSR
jgi:peptide/nickel transport system substrate-binding protein